MSSDQQTSLMECLRSLANQPGAVWACQLECGRADLCAVLSDGSLRSFDPAESVLLQAILSASAALSDRLGLGLATGFEHRFEDGGLLVHCAGPQLCLVLCHAPASPVPLLRLALKQAGSTLLSAPANRPPEPAHHDFSAPFGAGANAIFGAPGSADPSGQSKVYNPFSTA